MSLYVLDTESVQLYQDGLPQMVRRVRAVAPSERAISIVTVEEQLSGWYAQLRQAKDSDRLAWAYRRLAATIRFLAQIEILDFDRPAIDRYEELRKRKLKIGKMDLRIAATVLERGAILVTRNLRDFRQVPGLQIEDWSK
jgi:tRNA(fMet)-specific endonuclease VapC